RSWRLIQYHINAELPVLVLGGVFEQPVTRGAGAALVGAQHGIDRQDGRGGRDVARVNALEALRDIENLGKLLAQPLLLLPGERQPRQFGNVLDFFHGQGHDVTSRLKNYVGSIARQGCESTDGTDDTDRCSSPRMARIGDVRSYTGAAKFIRGSLSFEQHGW